VQGFVYGAALLQPIAYGLFCTFGAREVDEVEVPIFGGFDAVAERLRLDLHGED
jgi:hypothetical protein